MDASAAPIPAVDIQEVLGRRAEMRVATAAVAEAQAKAQLEEVSARPDLNPLEHLRTQSPCGLENRPWCNLIR